MSLLNYSGYIFIPLNYESILKFIFMSSYFLTLVDQLLYKLLDCNKWIINSTWIVVIKFVYFLVLTF
jgi:hypothetical protein